MFEQDESSGHGPDEKATQIGVNVPFLTGFPAADLHTCTRLDTAEVGSAPEAVTGHV